jgi:glutaredoxin 2
MRRINRGIKWKKGCDNYMKNEAYAKMAENKKDETIKNLEELLRQKSDLIENMENEIAQLKEDLKSKHFEWDGLDE